MASPAMKKLAVIWSHHGDRIVIALLVVLLALGVTFAIQRKSTDASEIVERLATSGQTTRVGVPAVVFDADKVLHDIQAPEPTTPYIEISSKNVFYTPQQWNDLKGKLERSYQLALTQAKAANPSGWKAAAAELDKILTLDPEQIRLDYNQGKPSDLAAQCRDSLKIDELNTDWNRAQQEWDRALDFESKGRPIDSAGALKTAVELYNKIVEQGKSLVDAERLTESRTRADQGSNKIKTLLGTHLTQDVRDKTQQIDARLAPSATMELPALVELSGMVNDLQKTLDTYSTYVDDAVENAAKDKLNQARQRITTVIPGLYNQATTQLKNAIDARDVAAAQQVLDRLIQLRGIEPDLPRIDEYVTNTQAFIADGQKSAAGKLISDELDRLKTGYDRLMKLKAEENWDTLEQAQKELCNNKVKFLDLADKTKNPMASQLRAWYTRIEQIAIPKEVDFIEVTDFPPRGGIDKVNLRDTKSDRKTGAPLAVGQRWQDGGYVIEVKEIDAKNGVVKIAVQGFRLTTLTKK